MVWCYSCNREKTYALSKLTSCEKPSLANIPFAFFTSVQLLLCSSLSLPLPLSVSHSLSSFPRLLWQTDRVPSLTNCNQTNWIEEEEGKGSFVSPSSRFLLPPLALAWRTYVRRKEGTSKKNLRCIPSHPPSSSSSSKREK